MFNTVRIIILFVVLTQASQVFAGGWLQPEGDHYVKVWMRSLMGKKAFLSDGQVRELDANFKDISLSAYSEYGLNRNTTIVLSSTFLGLATFESDDSNTKTGDTMYIGPLELSMRKAISTGPLKVAFQFGYGYTPPVGNETIAEGALQDENMDSCGGSCLFFYTPTVNAHRVVSELQVGYGFLNGIWITGNVGGGYPFLVEDDNIDLDPTIHGVFQVGKEWSSGLVANFHLNFVQPLGDVIRNEISGRGQTKYISPGVGMSYWLTKHWSVLVGADFVIQAASNLGALPIAIGIEHR